MTNNSLADAHVTSPQHKFYWLPNALTIVRIALIPILIAGILSLHFGWNTQFGGAWVLAGVYIFAVATDFFDGFLARRWNVVSDFGRMIDPIADKLLVAGCLIAFMIASQGAWVFMVPALAIIGRDILVSGAREHAALAGRVMPPTNLAKWKTACEMLAIAALLVWVLGKAYLAIDTAIPSIWGAAKTLGLVLLWLAAVLSVYTGSLYFRAALKS
ncbi:MAG: CDP-diacylglycerol--glycerol-3-phosphate 3-phosphatidyltransferase [Litorimonas sp.]